MTGAKGAPPSDSIDGAQPTDRQHPVHVAELSALEATSHAELREAIERYEHCDLKESARNLVFSDGNPRARVMIVGEAPGADEDRLGKPFVGRAGRLLDAMFAEIGLRRDSDIASEALYISNLMPWRPPGNRNPTQDEADMMKPFIIRHIELTDPELLVLVGNVPCNALLGKTGITRMRGNWHEFRRKPVMPTFHPAYLLRNPVVKRDVWIDLLRIRRKLEES